MDEIRRDYPENEAGPPSNEENQRDG